MLFVCPGCGFESKTSLGMACHCLLQHGAGVGKDRGIVAEAISRLMDDLSSELTKLKAEDPPYGTERAPAEGVLSCNGSCQDCSSRLLQGLHQTGHVQSAPRPRKWLYHEYPGVAIIGVQCLRYANGFWYLKSDKPDWLRNPFQSDDGYWYEHQG